ncbi:MAG: hypothetical protein Q9M94_07110 [Candidatus Gracilibacteria bacterium]|nr:hypothetical protein [Candidatus Gracilibacteria bacterium]
MLVKNKNDVQEIKYYCINKSKNIKKSLLDNLKMIQFSNKEDKNLSLNIDEYLYGK